MLLSHPELVTLVTRGVIRDVPLENVNAASIDITLGSKILVESAKEEGRVMLSLAKREPMKVKEFVLSDEGRFMLHPGQFVLAQSEQTFYLPNNISAEYKLKSSMARVGINHALAGWCDAGWNGSVLTLELMNVTRRHVIELRKGDKIGQMIFFRHAEVNAEHSYAGKGSYNGDVNVSGAKSKGMET